MFESRWWTYSSIVDNVDVVDASKFRKNAFETTLIGLWWETEDTEYLARRWIESFDILFTITISVSLVATTSATPWWRRRRWGSSTTMTIVSVGRSTQRNPSDSSAEWSIGFVLPGSRAITRSWSAWLKENGLYQYFNDSLLRSLPFEGDKKYALLCFWEWGEILCDNLFRFWCWLTVTAFFPWIPIVEARRWEISKSRMNSRHYFSFRQRIFFLPCDD